MDQYYKYFPDQEKLNVYHVIGEWLLDNMRARTEAGDRSPVGLSWLVWKARKELGKARGFLMILWINPNLTAE